MSSKMNRAKRLRAEAAEAWHHNDFQRCMELNWEAKRLEGEDTDEYISLLRSRAKPAFLATGTGKCLDCGEHGPVAQGVCEGCS